MKKSYKQQLKQLHATYQPRYRKKALLIVQKFSKQFKQRLKMIEIVVGVFCTHYNYYSCPSSRVNCFQAFLQGKIQISPF